MRKEKNTPRPRKPSPVAPCAASPAGGGAGPGQQRHLRVSGRRRLAVGEAPGVRGAQGARRQGHRTGAVARTGAGEQVDRARGLPAAVMGLRGGLTGQTTGGPVPRPTGRTHVRAGIVLAHQTFVQLRSTPSTRRRGRSEQKTGEATWPRGRRREIPGRGLTPADIRIDPSPEPRCYIPARRDDESVASRAGVAQSAERLLPKQKVAG